MTFSLQKVASIPCFIQRTPFCKYVSFWRSEIQYTTYILGGWNCIPNKLSSMAFWLLEAPVVWSCCYSNEPWQYVQHCWKNTNSSYWWIKIKKNLSSKVVNKLYQKFDRLIINKIDEIFPQFEFLPHTSNCTPSRLSWKETVNMKVNCCPPYKVLTPIPQGNFAVRSTRDVGTKCVQSFHENLILLSEFDINIIEKPENTT